MRNRKEVTCHLGRFSLPATIFLVPSMRPNCGSRRWHRGPAGQSSLAPARVTPPCGTTLAGSSSWLARAELQQNRYGAAGNLGSV